MTSPFADTDAEAAGLLEYVDASPTPFHAVAQARDRLTRAGFTLVEPSSPFPREPGGYVVVRGGSLVAWHVPPALPPSAPFRVVAGHTDSPNLRVKPRPDRVGAGFTLLGVEPYGGLLANSWLDRDLGLAGRVTVRTAAGPEPRLFHDPRPLLRVAQLAIHLDRGVNEHGLVLGRQQHLVPLWGLGDTPASFLDYVAEQVGAPPSDVLAWDAMLHDTQPGVRLGRHRELLAAPRLDNLATAYAGVRALLTASARAGAHRTVLVLFDHEEVGSESERGARGVLLPAVLERVVLAAGGGREELWRALARSVVASGDMAHATHPNYVERHEPGHPVALGAGPVLKVHSEQRYATDSLGAAAFRMACEQAGVPMQVFVVHSDLPCGSTVGPMTAAGLGVTTVDVGAPLLSMHSARELGGAQDPATYAAALTAFLAPVDPLG